jgi:hypothetical protein
MSDLLNSASLVLIPSGYKEDVVYSAVPTDGSGDLSFTRASNGTRVNSAGLVEVCPWNLLEQSNNFSISASWLNDGTTETGGQAGYDGTNNAWLLIPSTTDTYHTIKNSFSEIGVVTYSVYAKAQTYNGILVFSGQTGNGKFFNLSNGTLGDNFGTGIISSSIESVGNGWYRCSMTVNRTAAGTFEILVSSDGISTYSFAGNGTGGVFIQNAQANISSTAKPYFPTTDRLNVPRLTYQNGGGGCPSLLLEKQSTNLLSYSEQFDNAYWTKAEATLTANATTSPDGTQNADSLIPSTTNSGAHVIFQSVSNSIATASYSMYIKPNGYNRVAFRENSSTGAAIGFDLLNQTIITTYSTGGCTASNGVIQDVGDGWYRISGVFSFASATNQSLALYIVSSSWTSGDPTSVAWSGNGTSGIYIYGAQVEASSYPTSYIPTTSASATRVADACFKTGISSLIGQSEGVLFVDVNFINTGDVQIFCEVSNGGANRVLVYASTTTIICYANATVFSYTQSTNERLKIAFAYKSGDSAFYVNGVQKAVSSSSLSYSGLSQLNIGSNYINDQPTNSPTNQAILFKTRLTNSELASLTTL